MQEKGRELVAWIEACVEREPEKKRIGGMPWLEGWVEGETKKKREEGSVTCEKEKNKERPRMCKD